MSETAASPSTPAAPAGASKPQGEEFVDRWYYPKIWDGLDFGTWARMLVRNRFAVHWTRWSMALVVTLMAPGHSFFKWLQAAFLNRKIRRTPLAGDPLFIIGHWRSGTTFLHELMVLDPRFTFPTTYECFAPHHFLITEGIVTTCFNWLMPERRPMDNMAVGWKRPQEDEFALCAMGLPSPYATLAFPNHPPQHQEYFTFDGVPADHIRRWKEKFLWFLQQVTCRDAKRIVLKSPPHTGRVRVLQEMFPQARFIHIVRDPYVMYSSSMKMWKAMYEVEGLQVPRCAGLDEWVFNTLTEIYGALERDRAAVPAEHWVDVRYEDLVRDPLGQMQAIYDRLQLGEFDQVVPHLQAHLAGVKDYQPNRHKMDPELRKKIATRWRDYIARYGYEAE